ncbi:MAG: sulfite oxidase heme-binding subunit YedZ [Rhodoferax sp.]
MPAWTFAAISEPVARPGRRWRANAAVWLVHALCCAPLLWLWAAALLGQLGPNPAEALVRGSGDWALRFLCLALAVTPLRQALGWAWLARWRRPLGLYCFAYALAHFLSYAWLDLEWEAQALVRDVLKRPFITLGMASLAVLLPLALTSPKAVARRLGARRWQALHRSVYLLPFLVLTHFYWMRAGKNDFAEVSAYALLLLGLLAWRLMKKYAPGPRGY